MLRSIFILILIIPGFCYGQKTTITKIDVKKDYYPYITFLSEGEIDWIDINNDEYKGVSHRLVITTSEIYNKIYSEEVNYGMEGCCKKIVSKKEIPISEIFEKFNLDGERTGVNLLEWLNPTTLTIKIQDYVFEFSDLDKDVFGVQKLNNID